MLAVNLIVFSEMYISMFTYELGTTTDISKVPTLQLL